MQKRSLTPDETAVSPVVGVILMVAITVVVAAVVFVLVTGMGHGKDDAPRLTFYSDPAARTLTVVTGAGDGHDITPVITAGGSNTCGATLTHAGATTTLTSGQPATASSRPVDGNDLLRITSTGAGTCQVAFTHQPSNENLGGPYTFTF